MRNKINIALLIIVGSWSGVFCQSETDKTLQKVVDVYKNSKTYQIEVTYSMLRGLTGNHVTETYKGEVTKSGNVNQFSIMGSEIIQSPDMKLTLDHKNQIMMYAAQKDEAIQGSPVDISMLLEYFTLGVMREEKGILRYEMISNKKVPQFPYGKIVLHIDKASNYIKKQELFFSKLMPFKEGPATKMDYARLVIDLDYPNNNPEEALLISNYVVIDNGKLATTQKYQDYKLIEQAQ